MRAAVLLLSLLSIFSNGSRLAASDVGDLANGDSILKMVPVTSISDGYFGGKRLYFNLACNERFMQVLTERKSQSALDVGILVEELDYSCNRPDRELFGRVTPNGRDLHPVMAFNEVWYCSAMCYTGGGPNNMPNYEFVSAFGTSENQATNNLACGSAYLINLRCGEEDVN